MKIEVNFVEGLYLALKAKTIILESDAMAYFDLVGEPMLCEVCFRKMSAKRLEYPKIRVACSFCDNKKVVHLLKKEFVGHNSNDLLYFIYYFSLNLDRYAISKLIDSIGKNKINDLYLSILEAIHTCFKSGIPIGGEGDIMEVDETFVGKRKYNRGRILSQKIIFGGISRVTGKIFMKIVVKRNTEELGAAIVEFIKPETLVYSDKWAAYSAIFRNNSSYTHGTVNHSINFVDPVTRVHTQNIESLWSSFKRFKRRKGYSKQAYLPYYISEFIFRRNFDSDLQAFTFYHIKK